MIMKREQVEQSLIKFFSKNQEHNFGTSKKRDDYSYFNNILALANEYPDKKHLEVQYKHIELFNRDLAETLIEDSDMWLAAATYAIGETPLPHDELLDVIVRVVGLPAEYEVEISDLKKYHVGKFLSIRCTVSKATDPRPKVTVIHFQCLRCGHITEVTQSDETKSVDKPFAGCSDETCGKNGPYKILVPESEKVDHQFLKVQEPLESLRFGRQPKFLYVTCTEDLVDKAKPGDKIIINGILEGRLKIEKDGPTQFIEYNLAANSINKSDKDFESIEITPEEEAYFIELSKSPDLENKIYSSICPSIYGHMDVKMGMAFQLFAGVRTKRKDGTDVRGDIHVILVGDPGVAKSKFLTYAVRFAPRAVMGTGGSVSGVGICGAAEKDDFDGKWAIKAGLITMAGEGGIMCLDEMDKMRPEERAAMHTAMEQQYVDIAKAGVFAHLPAMCGVLGAANPKYGRFNPYESIASQFNLGDALLSRFDLVYVIRDVVDKEFDSQLAETVLSDDEPDMPILDSELLRKYMAYAKINFAPKMTSEAKEYLKNFYVATRHAGIGKDTIPITVRTLEAAKRLSAAHAKMRLSNSITLSDAKAAVDLLISNLHEVGVDPDTGELDSSVLFSGISGSQNHRIKTVKSIISKLCKQNISEGFALVDSIKKLAEDEGIKDSVALLNRMREKGDVFFPTQNAVKLVV